MCLKLTFSSMIHVLKERLRVKSREKLACSDVVYTVCSNFLFPDNIWGTQYILILRAQLKIKVTVKSYAGINPPIWVWTTL